MRRSSCAHGHLSSGLVEHILIRRLVLYAHRDLQVGIEARNTTADSLHDFLALRSALGLVILVRAAHALVLLIALMLFRGQWRPILEILAVAAVLDLFEIYRV